MLDAGNVDDVVVHPTMGPTIYRQVKYTVDLSVPLTYELLIESSGNGRSLLQKFYDSYIHLKQSTGESPDMRLETTRHIDPADPLLRHIDNRTATLTPRINDAGPRSDMGMARQKWIDHLGVSEEQLLEMLDHLAFRVARPAYEHAVEECGVAMRAVGLRGKADDVNAGVDAIRKRVIAGLRNIEPEDLEQIIRDAALEPVPQTATLMVQAIDWRDTADMATASVDWVDLFVGDEPGVRRELHDPADWDGRLRPELQAAIQRIRSTGMTNVAIEGAMRLSVFFLAGRELSSVSGFNVTHNARGVEWASRDTSTTMDLAVTPHDIRAGDDIAIGLSVTGDITEDVLDYVQRAKLPVAKVVDIAPATGPGRDALTPENAPEWAEATIAEIKRASRGHGKIHLFLYGPGQAALLLGNAWNRVPTVQVYEDLGPGGRGYTPTFLIPG
ncbi:MAG: SAVED domain-containing protein [Conexibacter sp.]